MNEKPITIYIHDLEISDKSKSFLARVGMMKLNDLLNCDIAELSATRNISEDVLQELNGVKAHSDDISSVSLRNERNESKRFFRMFKIHQLKVMALVHVQQTH